jgi:hypothetical protein
VYTLDRVDYIRRVPRESFSSRRADRSRSPPPGPRYHDFWLGVSATGNVFFCLALLAMLAAKLLDAGTSAPSLFSLLLVLAPLALISLPNARSQAKAPGEGQGWQPWSQTRHKPHRGNNHLLHQDHPSKLFACQRDPELYPSRVHSYYLVVVRLGLYDWSYGTPTLG